VSLQSPLGIKSQSLSLKGPSIKLSEQADNEITLDTFEFEAGPERERFDQFLALRLPRVSLTRLRRAIAEGDAVVNGTSAPKGTRLSCGDRVRLVIVAAEPSATTPEPIPLDILYEDAELIAVNKPAGLLAHPSRTEKSGTLTNALAYYFLQTAGEVIRPGLIHRLDRETSGVIVIAKTARAHRLLSKAFRQRRVVKRYLGLVSGQVALDAGEVEAPIGREATAWPRWRVMSEGRSAHTRYTVRQRFANHTLLELEPLTGRTHQLRIHCAFLGHPVVGDRLYGINQESLAERLGLSHHLLHAYYLAFRHPTTGSELAVTAPLPTALTRALESLKAEEALGRGPQASAGESIN